MGWERRARGGRYYTRSRKVGGRVVREYVGSGIVGELAEQQDAARRAARAVDAAAWRQHCADLRAADADLQALCDQADLLMRGALLLAGYHQHHRGEWRRPREQ